MNNLEKIKELEITVREELERVFEGREDDYKLLDIYDSFVRESIIECEYLASPFKQIQSSLEECLLHELETLYAIEPEEKHKYVMILGIGIGKVKLTNGYYEFA